MWSPAGAVSAGIVQGDANYVRGSVVDERISIRATRTAEVDGRAVSACNNVTWTELGEVRSARWRSESAQPPKRLVIGDDRMSADSAYRLAAQGIAILWRGDFQNARLLLQAL